MKIEAAQDTVDDEHFYKGQMYVWVFWGDCKKQFDTRVAIIRWMTCKYMSKRKWNILHNGSY